MGEERERFYAVGFEDGERGHRPRNAGGLWKLEAVRKGVLL